MDKATFTSLLTHPEGVSEETTASLQHLVQTYPYLQSARALYLKSLKNANSYQYNAALKQTAAHTTDRSVLFHYITSQPFLQPSAIPPAEPTAITPVNQEAEAIFNPQLFVPKYPLPAASETSPEESLQLGKPLDFNPDEHHSFNEWLKLTSFPSVEKETYPNPSTPSEEQKKEKFDRIDKFIAQNPKITPRKGEPVATTPEEPMPFEKSKLMTETLARIYVEQKKYKEAIQAYKILSLKYPEKSGFFADQMKAIKKLEQNNDTPWAFFSFSYPWWLLYRYS